MNSVLAFSTATGQETVLYRASPSGDYDTGCWLGGVAGAGWITAFP